MRCLIHHRLRFGVATAHEATAADSYLPATRLVSGPGRSHGKATLLGRSPVDRINAATPTLSTEPHGEASPLAPGVDPTGLGVDKPHFGARYETDGHC